MGKIARRWFLMKALASALLIVGLLAGCSKTSESNKPVLAEKPAKENAVQAVQSKEAELQHLPLQVVSVQKALCCSDRPGKLMPSSEIVVEGLSNDNLRFVLACWDWNTDRFVTTKSGAKEKRADLPPENWTSRNESSPGI